MGYIKVEFTKKSFIEICGNTYDNFNIPIPPVSFDKFYKVKELVGTDVKFSVNLNKMMCTCADFTKDRKIFDVGTIKRCCLHLKEAYCFLCRDILNDELVFEFMSGVKTIRPWHVFMDFIFKNNKALFHFEPNCHNTTSFVVKDNNGLYTTVSYDFYGEHWLNRNSKSLSMVYPPPFAEDLLNTFSAYISKNNILKNEDENEF